MPNRFFDVRLRHLDGFVVVLAPSVSLEVKRYINLEISARRMNETNWRSSRLKTSVHPKSAHNLTSGHADLDCFEVPQAILNPRCAVFVQPGIELLMLCIQNHTGESSNATHYDPGFGCGFHDG